jgi:hypothetical protein
LFTTLGERERERESARRERRGREKEREREREREIDLEKERDTRHTLGESAQGRETFPSFFSKAALLGSEAGLGFCFPSPSAFLFLLPFPLPLPLICLSSMMPFFIHICVSGVERGESEQGAGLCL